MNNAPADRSGSVSVLHAFASSPDKVFDAWVKVDIAKRWLFATPGGKMVKASADATEGGAFLFTEKRDGEDVEHRGNFLIIDRPRRLVFIFSVPKYSVLETPVTVTFVADGHGCKLTLIHDYVPDDMAVAVREGWSKMLEGLAAVLGESA